MSERIRGLLFFAAILALLCVGCSGTSDAEYISKIEQAALKVKDPSNLLYAFAVVTGSISLLLIIFEWYSLWDALLHGLRYTSLVAAIAAPLYALMLDPSLATSWMAGVAMEISGIVGIICTYLLLRKSREISVETPLDPTNVDPEHRQRKR